MASSSSAGETAAGFDLGGGGAAFLENSATIFDEPAEGGGAERVVAAVVRRVPRSSDAPREAGAVAAAMDAMEWRRWMDAVAAGVLNGWTGGCGGAMQDLRSRAAIGCDSERQSIPKLRLAAVVVTRQMMILARNNAGLCSLCWIEEQLNPIYC